jgi:low affinity Fe/Cu permease
MGVAKRKQRRAGNTLERFSRKATDLSGTSGAFALAVAIIVVWLLSGPVFGFSDTWQLIINTGTTIVTFLMVFLIQRGQNKDTRAVHLKLNELVAALQGASNRLIDVEALSEEELQILQKHYHTLAELAKRDADLRKSHSVEEAKARHGGKMNRAA